MPKNPWDLSSDPPLLRSPDLFHDPERYYPSRWTGNCPPEYVPAHEDALLVFAPGARGCIGKHFAIREAQVFLVKLLSEFRWGPGAVPPNKIHRGARGTSTRANLRRRMGN